MKTRPPDYGSFLLVFAFAVVLLLVFVFAFSSVPADGQVTVTSSSFAMQCPNNNNGCHNPPSFPGTAGEPVIDRFWDSGISWAQIDNNSGISYSDTILGQWIDACFNSSKQCHYQFAGVPLDLAPPNTQCLPNGSGCTGPPTDLARPGGSPRFHAFVAHLINYVSPNGHSFASVVKYLEAWNEHNSIAYWANNGNGICGVGQTGGPGGTLFAADCAVALYQMWQPEIAQILAKMPTVTLLTPNISLANGTAVYQSAQCNYIEQEARNTQFSMQFAFHTYLTGASAPPQVLPEAGPLTNSKNQLAVNSTPAVTCNPYIILGDGSVNNYNLVGWSGSWTALTPNMSELGFTSAFPFHCLDVGTQPAECGGIPVREQLLMHGLNVKTINWYSWYNAIVNGGAAIIQSDYVAMQTLLNNHRFSTPCTNVATTWQCATVENNGAGVAALWVWTTNTAGDTFVATGFSDYQDLHGNTVPISNPATIAISVEPLMLEANPPATVVWAPFPFIY